MKENLNMSFRKATPKPRVVDVQKLSVIRAMFWFRMLKRINENLDEWSFSSWISNK